MQFTEEQLRAIKTRDTNILVSAGAGSGKTGVLTERILDRLRDGDSINELLVLTYTKAAAAEMRSRIRSKIADALAMSQGTEREHWEKQMMFLSDAPITTLHSFCLRLLRRHYQMIPGLDPDFRILDPNQASVHRQDLLKAFLEECYMEPEEEKRERFFTVLRSYGTRLSDEGLKKEILHLIEFGRPQGDLEQWLRQMLRRFGDADFWHRQVLELAEQELRIVIDTLKGALRDCRANGGPVKYEETLSQDIKALEELSGSDWDTWRNAAPFGTLGRAKKDDNVAVREYVKSRRDAAKTYFKNKILPFFQKDFSHYVREISCCYSEMETLVELTLAFHERYQSYKLKQNFWNSLIWSFMLIAFYKITKRFGRDIGMIFEKFSLMSIRISTPFRNRSFLCFAGRITFLWWVISNKVFTAFVLPIIRCSVDVTILTAKKMEKERG